MHRWNVVGLLAFVVTGSLGATGEPRPLAEEQPAELRELYRHLAETQRQAKAGKLPEAIAAAEKMLALERKVFGDRHEAVAGSQEWLAGLHERREDWPSARKARQEVVSIRTALYGKNHWRVKNAELAAAHGKLLARLDEKGRQKARQANEMNERARQLSNQGKYAEAVPLAQQVVAARKELLGEDHPYYAQSLDDLGMLYKDLGNHRQALALVQQACDLRKKLLGDSHFDYAESLDHLGRLYKDRGDYAQALPFFEQARDLYKTLVGEDHPSYAASVGNLAGVYRALGDYARALPLYQETRDRLEKQVGKDNINYAIYLNNLAALYHDMGDYPKSLKLLEETRDLYRKLVGEGHFRYAISLNNLAVHYLQMGDYPKALPLCEQARDLFKKAVGEDHLHYADSLANLGMIYQHMGDYPKALSLYEQARDLRKRLLGEDHPSHALSLLNLAGLYQDMGEYSRALPLMEQARDLIKKRLGENHTLYAFSLNSLAVHYQAIGDYPNALPLFKQACDLNKKLLGEEHPTYAQNLDNLASLYRDMGNFSRALTLFEQVRELRKKTLGESHPGYATSLGNLALLHSARKDYARMVPLYKQALDLRVQFWQEGFGAVGERQRLRLLDSVRRSLDNYLSGAQLARVSAADVYPTVLTWKGAVTAWQSADLLLRGQPELRRPFEQLQSVQARLAKLSFDLPSPVRRERWLKQLQELRDQKEQLEADLARASKVFRDRHPPLPTVAELCRLLPRDAILVDFITFRTQPVKERKDKRELTDRLLAFVVGPGQDAQMLYLGELKLIEQQVQAWRTAILSNNSQALAAAGDQLQRSLWEPLQKYMGKARVVLISPDGPLVRFPFAALPGSKPGSFLLEDLAIAYVTSGRQVVDLLRPPDDLPAPAGLLALGGLDYDSSPGRKDAFIPLPGTELEARSLRDQARLRFPDERTALLTGNAVTKDRLKEEVNKRWRYLHLATHGFFESPARLAAMRAGLRDDAGFSVEQRAQRDDVLAFLPLLKSGLVLSGANKATGTDALLTAEEVAALDLRGTELVVLSACETSLGDLTRADGVLGLQRAFHAGGARSVVASLWSVNDAATSLLMEEFYHNLWRKDQPLSKLEALRQAQLTVLKHPERVIERTKELRAEVARRGWPEEDLRGPKGKQPVVLPDGGAIKPGQPRRSPPAWWAAFVLSGEAEAAKR